MTTYRLAKKRSDFDKVIEKHGSAKGINHPVIMAERDGHLIGYLASYDFKPDYAPSAIQADNVHILMKMFALYDKTLASEGQLFYIIHISRENKPIIRMLDNWKNVISNGGNEKFLYYIRGIEDE